MSGQTPERLQRFVADEWSVPTLKEHATQWEFKRWSVLVPFLPGVLPGVRGRDHGEVLGDYWSASSSRVPFERSLRDGGRAPRTTVAVRSLLSRPTTCPT